MRFLEGEWVECLNADGREGELTVGNRYQVIRASDAGIQIFSDEFRPAHFINERFEVVDGPVISIVPPVTKTIGVAMNKQEYLKLHEEYCKRMVEITRAKNHDYTGSNADPFANFKAVETSGVCSTEQGFLVRMHDKMARIASFVQKGVLQVKDESVEDTLLDLANYSLLLAGFIKAKKQEER